jgi:MtN3 and saliva related transmembrane protein
MDVVSVIGFFAAACSVSSFVPQAFKILRTRDTASLSPPMYALTTTGFVLWTAYGIAQGQWPLILTNAVCFIFAAFILLMTLLPSDKKDSVADALDDVVTGPPTDRS